MINSPSDLSGPLDEGFTTFHVLIASATVVGSNHLVAASSMCVMDSRGRGTTQSCVGKHACTGLRVSCFVSAVSSHAQQRLWTPRTGVNTFLQVFGLWV